MIDSQTLINSTVDQTAEIATWIRDADPRLPVPSCPEWDLAKLVEHIGSTQRWVSELVGQRIADPAAAFGVGWESAPSDPAAWGDWLTGSAGKAVGEFAEPPAGDQVFDPSGTADGVAFWVRRLFGEISVHRIDASLTLGQSYQLSPDLAAAAIDDWLDTISSAGWAANVPGFADAMRGNGETIAWVADDVDQSWILRRSEAPLTLTRQSAGSEIDADVTVSGPAVDLLHVVSRRRPLDSASTCSVTGDRAELVHLIDNMNWVGA